MQQDNSKKNTLFFLFLFARYYSIRLMSDLKINQLDKSYHKVIDDLHEWKTKLNLKVDEMYENILIDMSQTLDDVHYFASFTNALLIEYENQLEKTTSNEEINLLEERINQITTEIELLQCKKFISLLKQN